MGLLSYLGIKIKPKPKSEKVHFLEKLHLFFCYNIT